MNNSTTNPILDDDAVDELAARDVCDHNCARLTPTERDALCQTVRVLRETLESLATNGRWFNFHRNVEEGDYFECALCNREAKRWNEIDHNPNCRIGKAKKLLEQSR